MKRAALFILVALTADAGGRFDRFNSRCVGGRSSRGLSCDDLAFFEFAPASGAGMGTACACTTPTGAKGEALTFTRAGDATCSKQGLATTGIANGDLVVCTANQPRVESSGGVLGLRVEGARTNGLLRSAELNNAAWTWENAGAAATTRTSDFAVAPDGTTTAERLQIPATSGVEYSDVYQTFSVTVAAATSCSMYVRGNGTSGTTDLCIYDGSSWLCQACSFVSGSWGRCVYPVAVGGGTVRFCKLGNNSNQNGGIARAAVDVLAWGAQGEEGAYATSYIPTVAVAVTRNAEAAYVTLPSLFAPGSVAATTQVPYTSPGANRRALGVRSGASDTNRFELFYANGGPGASTYVEVAGVGQQVNGVTAATMPGSNRFAAWRVAAGTQNVITNGTTESAATALGALPVLDRVYLGSYIAGGPETDGIVTRVCVDPSDSRCR